MTPIAEYLEYKRPMWSAATLKSEASRLSALKPLLSHQPRDVYAALKAMGKKPYTIKTMFIRACDYLDWAEPQLGAEYRQFMRANIQLFRNAYQTKQLAKSYEDVRDLIQKIPDVIAQDHALFILESGVRIHESFKVQVDAQGRAFVIGKGAKRRRVYATPPRELSTPWKLRQALKAVGLTPHDLRRLFATKLLRSGLVIHDVAAVTGHASIQTLMRYLQTSGDEELQSAINGALR